MDNLDVAPQELVCEVSPGTEVEQIELTNVLLVEIVSWVRVRLHDLPFEKLAEGELEHESTDFVSHLLRLSHQGVDLDSVHKLSAQDLLV